MSSLNSKYITNKSGLVLLGDIHGDWEVIKSFCQKYKDFCILQVGDFGVGFKHQIKDHHRLEKLAKLLEDSGNELMVIRGNHDDPSYFNGLCFRNCLRLLRDYSLIGFQDTTIQVVGGGISVDRSSRIPGKSYWENEHIVYKPEAVEKVDVFVSHVAPSSFPIVKTDTNPMVNHFKSLEAMQGDDLVGDLEQERVFMQRLSDLSECKKHFFGHYHRSHIYDDHGRYCRCLDINEFVELTNRQ